MGWGRASRVRRAQRRRTGSARGLVALPVRLRRLDAPYFGKFGEGIGRKFVCDGAVYGLSTDPPPELLRARSARRRPWASHRSPYRNAPTTTAASTPTISNHFIVVPPLSVAGR